MYVLLCVSVILVWRMVKKMIDVFVRKFIIGMIFLNVMIVFLVMRMLMGRVMRSVKMLFLKMLVRFIGVLFC